MYGLQKHYWRSKMFVARKSTPPTMSIAMLQGPGHGVCCSRQLQKVSHSYSSIFTSDAGFLVHMQVSVLLSK